MKLLRTFRGVLGSAITWAIPWALVGGLLAAGFELVTPALRELIDGPAALWFVFKAGAKLFGLIGALSGAVFAATLAVTGRRLTFSDLSSRRMIVLGAVGGASIAGALLGLVTLATHVWPSVYTVFLGGSALLGSSSAWGMWRLARQAPSDPRFPTIESGGASGSPALTPPTHSRRATT